MICGNTIRNMAGAVALALFASGSAWGQGAQPSYAVQNDGASNQKVTIFDKVGLDQRLNQQVPLDLTFMDEDGKPVQLRQYFGSKPVLLTLVYYQCPMLCSQVLNGVAGALNGIVRYNVGRDFDVLTVSFD